MDSHAAPAPLPVTVEDLGKQPDERGQRPGADLDVVGIARLTTVRVLDRDAMIPRMDQRITLARLDGALGWINALEVYLSTPERDEPQQEHPTGDRAARRPGGGKGRRIDRA